MKLFRTLRVDLAIDLAPLQELRDRFGYGVIGETHSDCRDKRVRVVECVVRLITGRTHRLVDGVVSKLIATAPPPSERIGSVGKIYGAADNPPEVLLNLVAQRKFEEPVDFGLRNSACTADLS
jgi:hypothetical protein